MRLRRRRAQWKSKLRPARPKLAATGARTLADVSGRFGQNLRDYHLTNSADYIDARQRLAETIVKLKGNGPDVTLSRKPARGRKRN